MPKLAETLHKIPVPAGVTVTVDPKSNKTVVKGPKGTLQRPFRSLSVKVRLEGNAVVVSKDLPRRKEKAMAGTYAAHIANMIRGVTNGWEYHLKVVFNHFPIKAVVQGEIVLVENFLGERFPRKANIRPGVKVSVKGNEIKVEGIDRQMVAQTAANIEKATKVRDRDVRIFQDGIYITSKGGKK